MSMYIIYNKLIILGIISKVCTKTKT